MEGIYGRTKKHEEWQGKIEVKVRAQVVTETSLLWPIHQELQSPARK